MSQSQMMEKDTVIVLDDNDAIQGSASKKESHVFSPEQPRGILHRAFSVFLFDESTNEMLLQQRASTKITFPNVRIVEGGCTSLDRWSDGPVVLVVVVRILQLTLELCLYPSLPSGLDQHMLLSSSSWDGTQRGGPTQGCCQWLCHGCQKCRHSQTRARVGHSSIRVGREKVQVSDAASLLGG